MSTIVNLKGHTIAFGMPITGFGDGSALEIEIPPDINKTVGVDGTVMYAWTGDESFKVKLKLMQCSLGNAWLSSLRAQNIAYMKAGGPGFFLPFIVKDNNGGDVITAGRGIIAKAPNYTLSNTPQSREWEIECAEGTVFLGGNPILPAQLPL